MRQRLIAFVVMVAFVVGLVAVARFGSHDVHPASLPKLPTGTAGAGEALATRAADAGTTVVPGAAGTAALAPNLDITVQGDLPDMPGAATAPAYRFADGRLSDDAVRSMASALGVEGRLDDKGDRAGIVADAGTVIVERSGARAWTMFATTGSSGGGSCTLAPDGSSVCSSPAVGSAADGSAADGGKATPTIGCAVPPCPPGADCPATTCAPPPPPTRPADLPSRDRAEQIARGVLAKVGDTIADAQVTVDDQFSAWSVRFEHRIGGRTVAGLVSTVLVGPKGQVVGGSGFRGTPVKLGDYPLAGSAVGLERLKQGRWVSGAVAVDLPLAQPLPMEPATTIVARAASGSAPVTPNSGASTPNSASGSASGPATTVPAITSPGAGASPEPPPGKPLPAPMPNQPFVRPVTVVTGVHLGLAIVGGGSSDQERIVPVYVFETANGGNLPAVPAVIDSLLEKTSPAGSRVTIEPGSVSGSGGGSTGGAVGRVEPAPPEPARPPEAVTTTMP